jgi:hypothetical protein
MESTFESRRLSEFTWRHLVRTYGEEFAEINVLPEAEYWRVVAARMQTQDTERNLIKELVPSEWAPTLAPARRFVQKDHHEPGASRCFPAGVDPVRLSPRVSRDGKPVPSPSLEMTLSAEAPG